MASFACIWCGCREGVEAALPVYCKDCYHHSLVYGYSNPTEDIALVHFVYWGRHLPGISEETAKRVLELAPMYEVKLHDLHGYRF